MPEGLSSPDRLLRAYHGMFVGDRQPYEQMKTNVESIARRDPEIYEDIGNDIFRRFDDGSLDRNDFDEKMGLDSIRDTFPSQKTPPERLVGEFFKASKPFLPSTTDETAFRRQIDQAYRKDRDIVESMADDLYQRDKSGQTREEFDNQIGLSRWRSWQPNPWINPLRRALGQSLRTASGIPLYLKTIGKAAKEEVFSPAELEELGMRDLADLRRRRSQSGQQSSVDNLLDTAHSALSTAAEYADPYGPSVTPEEWAESIFLKSVPAAIEYTIASLPEMVGIRFPLIAPFIIAGRSGLHVKERLAADDRALEGATWKDVLAGTGTATASAALDYIGSLGIFGRPGKGKLAEMAKKLGTAKRTAKGKEIGRRLLEFTSATAPRRVTRGVVGESVTEALQEGPIESIGPHLGTENIPPASEIGRSAAFGATIGGLGGGGLTLYSEVRGQKEIETPPTPPTEEEAATPPPVAPPPSIPATSEGAVPPTGPTGLPPGVAEEMAAMARERSEGEIQKEIAEEISEDPNDRASQLVAAEELVRETAAVSVITQEEEVAEKEGRVAREAIERSLPGVSPARRKEIAEQAESAVRKTVESTAKATRELTHEQRAEETGSAAAEAFREVVLSRRLVGTQELLAREETLGQKITQRLTGSPTQPIPPEEARTDKSLALQDDTLDETTTRTVLSPQEVAQDETVVMDHPSDGKPPAVGTVEDKTPAGVVFRDDSTGDKTFIPSGPAPDKPDLFAYEPEQDDPPDSAKFKAQLEELLRLKDRYDNPASAPLAKGDALDRVRKLRNQDTFFLNPLLTPQHRNDLDDFLARAEEAELAAEEAAKEAKKAAAKPTETPAPTIQEFDPTELEIDPGRFQFKRATDVQGVGERLRGAEKWDPIKAGVGVVWESKEGRFFVVDGHQRAALARRLAEQGEEAPTFSAYLFREEDGVTAEDVRAQAALKNISEGSGTAIDAVRVLQDLPEEAEKGTLSRTDPFVRRAMAMRTLRPGILAMVERGELEERFAAEIGRASGEDEPLQWKLAKLLADKPPASVDEAAQVVNQFIAGRQENIVTPSLFGSQEAADSIYYERGKILNAALKQLSANKRLFNALLKNAPTIEQAGNLLNRQANLGEQETAAQAREIVLRLANSKGPVSDALTRAAQSVREGGTLTSATHKFIEEAIKATADLKAGPQSNQMDLPRTGGRPGAGVGGEPASGEAATTPEGEGSAQRDDDGERGQGKEAKGVEGKKPVVTFSEVQGLFGDKIVEIKIDGKDAGSMTKAEDGTQWYTHGDEHPLLENMDLGTRLNEAKRNLIETVERNAAKDEESKVREEKRKDIPPIARNFGDHAKNVIEARLRYTLMKKSLTLKRRKELADQVREEVETEVSKIVGKTSDPEELTDDQKKKVQQIVTDKIDEVYETAKKEALPGEKKPQEKGEPSLPERTIPFYDPASGTAYQIRFLSDDDFSLYVVSAGMFNPVRLKEHRESLNEAGYDDAEIKRLGKVIREAVKQKVRLAMQPGPQNRLTGATLTITRVGNKTREGQGEGVGEKKLFSRPLVRGIGLLPGEEESPETKDLYMQLQDIVSTTAPLVSEVKTSPRLKDYKGGRVGGQFRSDGLKRVILLSLADNPLKNIHHEVIHALKDARLFSRSEWRMLWSTARENRWLDHFGIKEVEGYKSLPLAEQVEEAIAIAYSDWVQTGKFPPAAEKGLIERTFARVTEFFRRVVNTLLANGQPVTAGEVFRNIQSGLIGNRYQRDESGKVVTRYALAIPTEGVNELDKVEDEPFQEFLKEFREANGIPERTWKEAAGENLKTAVARVTRYYEGIPETPYNAELLERLRRVREASHVGRYRADHNFLRPVMEGLNQADQELVNVKSMLDNLSFTAERGMDLPFGLTDVDSVNHMLEAVNRMIARRPDLQDRLERRDNALKELTGRMIKSEVLEQKQAWNSAYRRHQVLEYSMLEASEAQAAGIQKPHWAKRRGSTKAINSNYFQAEINWVVKAESDIIMMDFIRWVRGSKHNVKPHLQRIARDRNSQNLLEALKGEAVALIRGPYPSDLLPEGLHDAINEAKSLPDLMQIMKSRVDPALTPLNAAYWNFQTLLARSFSQLKGRMSEFDEELVPPKLKAAYQKLLQEQTLHNDDTQTAASKGFEVIGWLAEQDEDLLTKQAALWVLKNVAARRKWVRTVAIPKTYVNPRSSKALIKISDMPNLTEWSPNGKRGSIRSLNIFSGKTVSEHVIEQATDLLTDEEGLGLNTGDRHEGMLEFENMLRLVVSSVRKQQVIGSPDEIIIDKGLGEALDDYRDTRIEKGVLRWAQQATSVFKRFALFSPHTWPRYVLNNEFTDVSAKVAGLWGVGSENFYTRLKEAIAEFKDVRQGGKPSEKMEAALEAGVFQSGQYATEGSLPGEPDAIDIWENLGRKGQNAVMQAPRKYFRIVRDVALWRENTHRYAVFLHYYDEFVDKDKDLLDIRFGMSPPEMVRAMGKNPVFQAGRMARDFFGDYSNTSVASRWLVNYGVSPFWRFQATNATRYYNLFKNAYLIGGEVGARSAGAGAAKVSMAGVILAAKLYAGMVAFSVAAQLWNSLMAGEEEDELGRYGRDRLHITLPRTVTRPLYRALDMDPEHIATVRMAGGFSDWAMWTGIEAPVSVLVEVARGSMDAKDLLNSIALQSTIPGTDIRPFIMKGAIEKFLHGMNPGVKVPFELISGRNFYPDISNPRKITDWVGHTARVFQLDPVYQDVRKFLFGVPTTQPGVMQRLGTAAFYNVNPKELAHWSTRQEAYDWLQEQDEGGSERRSTLSRELTRAMLKGDTTLVRRIFAAMQKEGMTQTQLKRSLQRRGPGANVAKKDRPAFRRSLSVNQRRRYDRSVQTWDRSMEGIAPLIKRLPAE